MALQLKNDNDEVKKESGSKAEFSDDIGLGDAGSSEVYSKFRGGLGDGTVDIDKINDLPTYTGPTVIDPNGAGVASGAKTRGLIVKIVVGLIVLAVILVGANVARSMLGSSGKDITEYLTLSEEELGKKLSITFEDDASKVKSVQHYSAGTITVRSGKELNVIYIDGKQCGIGTNSKKYKFFNIGINDAEQTALKNTTYQYDDSMIVINDVMNGQSDTYYYYNKKNNDCLVLSINNKTNRVVNMIYYTNLKKATETLSGLGD